MRQTDAGSRVAAQASVSVNAEPAERVTAAWLTVEVELFER